MFPLAVFLLIVGYAMAYTGAMNFANGGQGPTFAQSLGLTTAPPVAQNAAPNLTGQPVVGQTSGAAQGGSVG